MQPDAGAALPPVQGPHLAVTEERAVGVWALTLRDAETVK